MSKLELELDDTPAWMAELALERDREIIKQLLLDDQFVGRFTVELKKEEFKLWSKQLMRELFDTSEEQIPKPIDTEHFLELIKRKTKEYNEGKKR